MTDSALEQIRAHLLASDEEIRLQAVRQLRQIEGWPLEWLLAALGDGSWRVRKEAVGVFLWRPAQDEAIQAVLAQLYAEENAGLRNAAMEILVRLGRQALPLLHRELASDDHDVRKFVVDILGEIRDPSSTPFLIASLKDADENVRNASAENLGKLGAAEAVPALLEAMEVPDLWFRFTILDALGHLGGAVDVERLLKYVREPLLRKALFDCLGRIGNPRVIPLLVEGLADAMRNVREAAALALAAIGRRYPNEVRAALAGESGRALAETAQGFLAQTHPALRETGVLLLGWIGSPLHCLPLLELAEDEQLAAAAGQALVDLGAPGVAELVGLADRQNERITLVLCHLIGETGCQAAFDFLVTTLRQATSPDLAAAAIQALGRSGDARAISLLTAELGNDTELRRQAAVAALVHLGAVDQTSVLAALLPLLENRDPTARRYTFEVLGSLSSPEVEKVLLQGVKDVAPEVRRTAVRALGVQTGPGRIRALKLALMDEDADVRALAAEMIGRSGDEDAVEALSLALKDEDPWVRTAAVHGLAASGASSWGVLSQAVNDPVGLVVIAALEALCEIDSARGAPHLEQALQSDDEEVVRTALRLLVRHASTGPLVAAAPRLLAHPLPSVRLDYLQTLVASGAAAAAELISTRLEQEQEESVREFMLDALARFRRDED